MPSRLLPIVPLLNLANGLIQELPGGMRLEPMNLNVLSGLKTPSTDITSSDLLKPRMRLFVLPFNLYEMSGQLKLLLRRLNLLISALLRERH